MSDEWILSYDRLDPDSQPLREALCTLGNGVFATRGAFEERLGGDVDYPGNYVAGGYNELTSEVAGRNVVNEDLVNFPNWLWLRFRPEDGSWLDPWQMEVERFRQELNMKRGILTRRMRVCDDEGRVTTLTSRRFVHMQRHHLAGIQWRVCAENWSGRIEIESGLDGSVINDNVARYSQLEDRHLDVVECNTVAPEGIFLKVRTNQSDIEMAQAARTRVFDARDDTLRHRTVTDASQKIAERFSYRIDEGDEIGVEKIVAQFTSRDRGVGNFGKTARIAVDDAPDFDELLDEHVAAWQILWHRSDVRVELAGDTEGPAYDQLVLRLHIFHLLQTASPNTAGRDVGIPARGLHGEAYRGHIFWDELFILPFYNMRFPSVARSTILYRYYRLDAAREIAEQQGCVGACFPWQSGSDGREATQELHLNPMSGDWDPDYSNLQRHINAAIVYNIWQYFQTTDDRAFMEEYGAEIILEIARYWSSLATRNGDCFQICGVVGPDEYHEKYPGAETGGLDNNAYTNITAVWCLLRAMDVLDLMAKQRTEELREQLRIDDAELQRWEQMTHRMKVPFHDGVISQFEGYEQLEEFPWNDYVERYDNIQRLDRILKAEDDSPDHYKASKQGDVTMLLYLFRPRELKGLLHRLGYEFDDADLHRNVEYYRARTSHGSTLSRVVYTSVVHRYNPEEGARLFLAALESDLCDVQGGTTPEGIHLGAMAGTVDIVKRHYAGIEVTPQGLTFFPNLPRRIDRIAFRARYRNRWYDIDLTHDRLRVSVDEVGDEPVTIRVEDQTLEIAPDDSVSVEVEATAESKLPSLEQRAEKDDLAPPITLLTEQEEFEWIAGECP